MKVILAVLLFAAGCVVYYEPMRWLVESWKVNPFYKHGFIVLLFSIGLAIFRIVKSKVSPQKNQSWIYFLGAGIVLYLIGYKTGINFLKTAPIFFTLLSIAYLLEDRIPAQSLRFPLLFPIIAVPIPFLPEFTAFLQFAMAKLSTGLMQIFGYDIVADGATIYLPDATFVIGAPSSGIQSLVALLTLMIPLIYFTNTSVKKKRLLYLLIVPVAVLGNLMRIVTLFLVGYYFGQEVAAEFWHDLGGVLFFVLTLSFLFVLWYFTVYGFKSFKARPAYQ
jgi:exosortase